jgi:hypothetical protein
MPRGIPGSGPNARKRLQRELQGGLESTEYLRLPLTEEETQAVYHAVTEGSRNGFGTKVGFHLTNVAYRITEYVMLDKMGLPKKEPPQPRPTTRRGRRRVKKGITRPSSARRSRGSPSARSPASA